jgi:hypothetical protein
LLSRTFHQPVPSKEVDAMTTARHRVEEAKTRLADKAGQVKQVAARPDVAEATEELKTVAGRSRGQLIQGGLALGAAAMGAYQMIKLALRIVRAGFRALRR